MWGCSPVTTELMGRDGFLHIPGALVTQRFRIQAGLHTSTQEGSTLDVDGLTYSCLYYQDFLLQSYLRECHEEGIWKERNSSFCTTLVLSWCPITIAHCDPGIANHLKLPLKCMSKGCPQQRGTAELQVCILEMPSKLSLLNHVCHMGKL